MAEKRKRKFGDRCDGRKLRSLPPISKVSPYIMPNRNGANNLIYDSVEIDAIEEFIARKRREGNKGFGMLYVFIAAYIRTVAKLPGINRFLSGQKVFARNDVQVVISIKKEMKLDAQDTTVKVYFSPDATVDEVYKKFTAEFEKNQIESETGDFDKTARILSYIPGLFFKFGVWFLKFLDYFGLLPKFLLRVSPFHGSMFITSMGSLGIPPIFHHLYDFGNIPLFLAMGAKRSQNELCDDGTVEEKKYVDFTFVMDERICDGHYYATALKLFKDNLRHPERLENAPDEVVEDIE